MLWKYNIIPFVFLQLFLDRQKATTFDIYIFQGVNMFESLGMFLSKLKCFSAFVETAECFPKPLSKEEEELYLKKYKEEKDMNAREILITRNLRLVPHIVKRFVGSTTVEADDMISVGAIGLIKAIDSFDAEKGVKLATYASRCIENEILMLIRVNKKHKDNVSLDLPVANNDGGDDILIMDMIADESEPLDEKLNNIFIYERVQNVVDSKLSPREREVIAKRYGLNGEKILTQKELAKQIGISRSYISRIEKKSIETIKASLDKKKNQKN